jgi:hypothetical protein
MVMKSCALEPRELTDSLKYRWKGTLVLLARANRISTLTLFYDH